MKKLLFGMMIILGSFSCFAMEIIESLDLTTGDTQLLITKPEALGSGLPFSRTDFHPTNGGSSEHGVCKALGYQKAASGSGQGNDRSFQDTIQVNSNGNIIGGSESYPLTRIVCLKSPPSKDKPGIRVNEKSVLIKDPKHIKFGLPFSRTDFHPTNGGSSEHGVCKALGYQKAASGSGQGNDKYQDTIQVNSKGNIVGYPKEYPLTQIICITNS